MSFGEGGGSQQGEQDYPQPRIDSAQSFKRNFNWMSEGGVFRDPNIDLQREKDIKEEFRKGLEIQQLEKQRKASQNSIDEKGSKQTSWFELPPQKVFFA